MVLEGLEGNLLYFLDSDFDEEMSLTVAVPFRVGNSVCENQTIDTHLEITRLKLMADTAGLLSDSVTMVSTVRDKDCSCSSGVESLSLRCSGACPRYVDER